MSSPFDYVKSITTTKENMMKDTANDELAEKEYKPWITNKALSYFVDTIIDANEMNLYHNLDNKLQYEYFINSIRPKNRYSKWFKKQNNADLEAVMEYYDYSYEKAQQALTVLNNYQINSIKEKLKGE